MYNVMLQELNMYPNRNSWAKYVQTVLENLGFDSVWLNQGVENETILIKKVKQCMRDNYLQDWTSEMDILRANTYRLFCSFGLETYLTCVKLETRFNLPYRFRVLAHIIAVETGMLHKTNKLPCAERKCTLCNT